MIRVFRHRLRRDLLCIGGGLTALQLLGGCGSTVGVWASPSTPNPVLLNAAASIGGEPMVLNSNSGAAYEFESEEEHSATTSQQQIGNTLITKNTRSVSLKLANESSHYQTAAHGDPDAVLVQTVRCGASFLLALGAAAKSEFCKVEGSAHHPIIARPFPPPLPPAPPPPPVHSTRRLRSRRAADATGAIQTSLSSKH